LQKSNTVIKYGAVVLIKYLGESIFHYIFAIFLTFILFSPSFGSHSFGQQTTISGDEAFDSPPYNQQPITSNLSNENNQCTNVTNNASSLAIETEKSVYAPLEGIKIIVDAGNDNNGCKIPANVLLEITKLGDSHSKVYRESFSSGTGAENFIEFTRNNYLALSDAGIYNMTVSTAVNGHEEKSWKLIQIQELYLTRFSFMMFVALAFFICLIILILKSSHNSELNEVLRFIFISGIIFSIILSLVFVNEKVSEVSPIGIVTKNIISRDESGKIVTSPGADEPGLLGDGQWVLNIGGQAPEYKFGMQIPIGIIVFGIAGGYLRYLYKTSKLYQEYKSQTGSLTEVKKENRIWIFYRSLEDISLLFLSPLLAVALWIMLTQAGMQGQEAIYTLSVVAFTVGLITEEVVQALITFTRSVMSGQNKEQSKNTKSN
jgi:hypothetical protein